MDGRSLIILISVFHPSVVAIRCFVSEVFTPGHNTTLNVSIETSPWAKDKCALEVNFTDVKTCDLRMRMRITDEAQFGFYIVTVAKKKEEQEEVPEFEETTTTTAKVTKTSSIRTKQKRTTLTSKTKKWRWSKKTGIPSKMTPAAMMNVKATTQGISVGLVNQTTGEKEIHLLTTTTTVMASVHDVNSTTVGDMEVATKLTQESMKNPMTSSESPLNTSDVGMNSTMSQVQETNSTATSGLVQTMNSSVLPKMVSAATYLETSLPPTYRTTSGDEINYATTSGSTIMTTNALVSFSTSSEMENNMNTTSDQQNSSSPKFGPEMSHQNTSDMPSSTPSRNTLNWASNNVVTMSLKSLPEGKNERPSRAKSDIAVETMNFLRKPESQAGDKSRFLRFSENPTTKGTSLDLDEIFETETKWKRMLDLEMSFCKTDFEGIFDKRCVDMKKDELRRQALFQDALEKERKKCARMFPGVDELSSSWECFQGAEERAKKLVRKIWKTRTTTTMAPEREDSQDGRRIRGQMAAHFPVIIVCREDLCNKNMTFTVHQIYNNFGLDKYKCINKMKNDFLAVYSPAVAELLGRNQTDDIYLSTEAPATKTTTEYVPPRKDVPEHISSDLICGLFIAFLIVCRCVFCVRKKLRKRRKKDDIP